MKKLLAAILGSLILVSVAVAPLQAQFPSPKPSPTRPAPRGGEKHPVLHRAITRLKEVRADLQKNAAPDMKADVAKAVKDIDEAIQELEAGIKADVK